MTGGVTPAACHDQYKPVTGRCRVPGRAALAERGGPTRNKSRMKTGCVSNKLNRKARLARGHGDSLGLGPNATGTVPSDLSSPRHWQARSRPGALSVMIEIRGPGPGGRRLRPRRLLNFRVPNLNTENQFKTSILSGGYLPFRGMNAMNGGISDAGSDRHGLGRGPGRLRLGPTVIMIVTASTQAGGPSEAPGRAGRPPARRAGVFESDSARRRTVTVTA
jgi:hypothetical protein